MPELEALPDDLRERIEAVRAKTGFIPNVFLVLARRPDEFRAFFAYYDALMLRDGRPEQGREGDDRGGDQRGQPVPLLRGRARRAAAPVLRRIRCSATRSRSTTAAPSLGPRQRAMLDAALKLARAPQTFGEDDLQALLAHGFSREDVWDIGAITALFALSNRLAHLARHAAEPRVLQCSGVAAPGRAADRRTSRAQPCRPPARRC